MELLSTSSPFACFSGLRQSEPRRLVSSVAGGQQCRHFTTVLAEQYNRGRNRKLKHARIRTKVEGTPERPRLAVFRSNQHLYCQVIDDSKMHTLAAMSTIQKPLRDELDLTSGPTIEAAKRVGEEIAKLCLRKGISKVAFDRGGFEYHGRIKALAESAREHGLDF